MAFLRKKPLQKPLTAKHFQKNTVRLKKFAKKNIGQSKSSKKLLILDNLTVQLRYFSGKNLRLTILVIRKKKKIAEKNRHNTMGFFLGNTVQQAQFSEKIDSDIRDINLISIRLSSPLLRHCTRSTCRFVFSYKMLNPICQQNGLFSIIR